MQTFQIYSAQTGDNRGRLEADSEGDALDRFAQARGYADRHDMWDRNQGTHYLSAYAVGEAL
jgi:hypothetical protein